MARYNVAMSQKTCKRGRKPKSLQAKFRAKTFQFHQYWNIGYTERYKNGEEQDFKTFIRAKSFASAKKILKLINKKTKVIISIFAGRAGDTGIDPIPEFKKSISFAKKFKNVQILWASVREPYNYLQAKQLGCHIITVPPSTIEKIENFGKTFEKLTKETVKGFLIDAKKSKFKI